jgi:hypothetical protein
MIDLGHGVRVRKLEDFGLEVESDGLTLPWMPRVGDFPGTGVGFDNELYEVVSVSFAGSQTRWGLRRWVDGEVMRVHWKLDRQEVAVLAHNAVSPGPGWSIWLIAPILALAPAILQRRWRMEWGFPAHAASGVSAFIELGIGSIGLIQVMVLPFGGGLFLGGPLVALVFLGPILFLEALIRLHSVLAAGEPMGSFFSAPFLLFVAPRAAARRPVVPRILEFDREGGVLELVSPIHRRDWDGGGVLAYHGRFFRLRTVERHGTDWLYRFEGVAEDAGGPRLKLVVWDDPPEHHAPQAPNPVRTAVITALVCLAPGSLQERWARHLTIRPAWLTVFGSCAELAGGVVNLETASVERTDLVLLVNLFFMIEGVARLALLAATGRPAGSLLGIPLAPILDRLVPPGQNTSDILDS